MDKADHLEGRRRQGEDDPHPRSGKREGSQDVQGLRLALLGVGTRSFEEEVAERLGWKVQQVREITDTTVGTISLDQPLDPGEGAAGLGDLVQDERVPGTPEVVIREEETVLLKEAIGGLPDRARYALVRRYGLDERKRATLRELAAELGISRERVRQLQREAENELRLGEPCRPL